MSNKQLIIKIKYIIEQNKILEKESIEEQDSIKMAYYKGYIGALENVLGDLIK